MSKNTYNCYLVSANGSDYAFLNLESYGFEKVVGEYLDVINRGDIIIDSLLEYWNNEIGFSVTVKKYSFNTKQDRDNAKEMIDSFSQEYDESKHQGSTVVYEEDVTIEKCEYYLNCKHCDKRYHFYDECCEE